MEKKMKPHHAEILNRVAAQSASPANCERPKREFKKRPEVKINKPFAALAGFKANK